jgi:hypothetical protein
MRGRSALRSNTIVPETVALSPKATQLAAVVQTSPATDTSEVEPFGPRLDGPRVRDRRLDRFGRVVLNAFSTGEIGRGRETPASSHANNRAAGLGKPGCCIPVAAIGGLRHRLRTGSLALRRDEGPAP